LIGKTREYLRSWLFPNFENQINDLNRRISELSNRIGSMETMLMRQDEEMRAILRKFDTKADSRLYHDLNEKVEIIGDELAELKMEVNELRGKLRFVEFSLSESPDKTGLTFEELVSLVEHYLKKGLNRPSELKKVLGIKWEKLYAILTYLKLTKRVKTIKEGNTVRWVLVEEQEKSFPSWEGRK
jgi:predicted  nucleic acid-binding Zn-ribbon protein